MRIDINCDMGESFGSYRIGDDDKIMPFITSANIACGWHAGDPMVMAATVRLAKEKGVAIGAHPGYPDLLGYGRRNIETFRGEIKNYILYQIGAISGFARELGLGLQHVKPHGALYNLAAKDEKTANEVISAIKAYDPELILMALAGSLCAEMARAADLRVAAEVFPDRAYLNTGQLAPRTMKDSVIHDLDKVKERVLRLVSTGRITSIDGVDIELKAETLCIHGDTPGAWEIAKVIRETLEAADIRVAAIGRK
jgi:5-oxoprolinase (ATP-hydrolysing) subunit A